MKRVARIIVACLLLSFAHEAVPQAASSTDAANAAPAPRPAISSIGLDNRGDDAVIVVLSRPSERAPFHHASRLPPGGKLSVPVPNLPSLGAVIMRRGEIRRAARRESGDGADDDGKSGGFRLSLGVAAGGRSNDRQRNGRQGEDREHGQSGNSPPVRDDRYGSEGGNHAGQDHAGQQHAGQQNPGHGNNGGNLGHALLGGLLVNALNNGDDNQPPVNPGDAPGEHVVIDAQGPDVRIVNGVAITVTATEGEAVAVDGDAGFAGAGNTIAISNDPTPVAPAPASTPPASSSVPPTCYCGPDMSVAYVEALRRARSRIEALPDSEKGPWDSAWWLANNGGNIDEIVRPARRPGQSDTAGAEIICPTGPCADLPGAGSGTMSLFGVCLPKHAGNDIMYGFVASLLDVPYTVQALGGHWAQWNTAYPSWDPPQSRAAYVIGGALAALEGDELAVGNAGNAFADAEILVVNNLNGVVSAGRPSTTPPLAYMKAVDYFADVYPALADCLPCPANATEAGTILRDWSNSVWKLNDGGSAYPPGYTEGE